MPKKRKRELEQVKYLTIKKFIEKEESYEISDCHNTKEWLQEHLQSGVLNIIQSATVEPILWIVDDAGHKLATLTKDGGTFDQKTEVEVL